MGDLEHGRLQCVRLPNSSVERDASQARCARLLCAPHLVPLGVTKEVVGCLNYAGADEVIR
jgi:hypothetical protein